MPYLSDMHHSEIGYASNPIQPDTERDRYEYQFEGWINNNYDPDTDTVFGVPYEDAWEDEGLFSAFMDEVRYEEMP